MSGELHTRGVAEMGRLLQAREVSAVEAATAARQRIQAHAALGTFLALDEEFHRTIALSVGRAHAWRVIENIKAQMDRIRYLSLDDATPLPLIIEQHIRMVDGIEAGDPTAAAAATRSHLREIIVSLPNIAARFPDFFEAN